MAKEKYKDGDNATINKKELANVLGCILSVPTPLKEDIATSDWLELKRALNPVNNMITKELTTKFIKNLVAIFQNTPGGLPDEIRNNIDGLINDNDSVNVNANGYDFFKSPIVAEVRANIPYVGDKYGASQKNGLIKDLNGLLLDPEDPGRPKKKRGRDLTNEYKFLVVLDYKRFDYNTLDAVKDLIKGDEFKEVEIIEDIKEPQPLDKKHVYIVMLDL